MAHLPPVPTNPPNLSNPPPLLRPASNSLITPTIPCHPHSPQSAKSSSTNITHSAPPYASSFSSSGVSELGSGRVEVEEDPDPNLPRSRTHLKASLRCKY